MLVLYAVIFCFVGYPLVMKHGLLQNPPFASMIFPVRPPFTAGI
jgi:hypothetical protein